MRTAQIRSKDITKATRFEVGEELQLEEFLTAHLEKWNEAFPSSLTGPHWSWRYDVRTKQPSCVINNRADSRFECVLPGWIVMSGMRPTWVTDKEFAEGFEEVTA